ncbi:DUF7575 domain-containing protein [Halobaculum magnesiiphilum]|uniref:DUF7575 domain-containing protein n=1 Tax=Halobaculum magnesiiphilum TaxID=1017351 RepID=A0A8T8WC26_9EURY|nr:hypothetical protein [Halobaculum magnesiiphilum]QZP37398.1 hypothetical protein K6T50_14145 [Halobaculum magnesiiphilum]
MRRRPAFAAALAVVPALGHAYLRRWTRGLAWLTLLAGATLVFAGMFGVDDIAPSSLGPSVTTALRIAVPVAVVLALSAVDAYVLAQRDARPTGIACPRCGRGVDLSIGFCWYCSVEFEYVDE